MFLAPPLKLFGSEFRAVVRSDDLRLASPSDNALQGSYYALGGQRSIDLNGQSFPCTIVHDVEGSEFAYPHDAIAHKIHAPAMIDSYGLLKGLSDSGWQTSLSSAFLIHFEELYPLVVILRSWYGSQFAGPAHRYAVIAYQFFGYLPLGGRAQPFFENRSLKSWLSIARSAYILLSRECSSSRVLSFWTSDTSKPPYLAFHL